MAGTPRIVTAPLISYTYTGSGAAFNILYTNSAYIKLSTGFASGAAQAANTGVMVLGSSISKTIANDATKGPDHCSIIANSIFPVTTTAGALGIKVNGGPIWNKATSLTYNGGWVQAITDPTATPSGTPLGGSGTALSIGNSVTNISMHMDQTYTGSAENMFEGGGMAGSWIGKEISVDGGTSTAGNEITFKSISDVDRSQTRTTVSPFQGNFYGHVEIAGGAKRLNGPVQLGNADGTTVLYMLDKDISLEWTDNPVNLKFYRLDIVGAATTIIWGDSAAPAPVQIASANVANNRWALDTSTQEPAAFTAYGCSLKHGRAWTLGSTTTLRDCNIEDVLDITLNSATDVAGSTFLKSYLISAFIPATALYAGITIRDVPSTDYGITISGAYGSVGLTLDGWTFLNNATGRDINFAHTGTITITLANGADTPSYTITNGGTVVLSTGVNVTFAKMKENSEVWVYTAGTFTQLAYIEDAVGGTVDSRSFTWNQSAGTVVDYVIHNAGDGTETYETIDVRSYTVPSTDVTINISQRLDRNFQ